MGLRPPHGPLPQVLPLRTPAMKTANIVPILRAFCLILAGVFLKIQQSDPTSTNGTLTIACIVVALAALALFGRDQASGRKNRRRLDV